MPGAPADFCQVVMSSSSAQTNSLRGHTDPNGAVDNCKRIKLESDEHGGELQQDEQHTSDVKLEHELNPELNIKDEPCDNDSDSNGPNSDPTEVKTKVAESKLTSNEALKNVIPKFQRDST